MIPGIQEGLIVGTWMNAIGQDDHPLISLFVQNHPRSRIASMRNNKMMITAARMEQFPAKAAQMFTIHRRLIIKQTIDRCRFDQSVQIRFKQGMTEF